MTKYTNRFKLTSQSTHSDNQEKFYWKIKDRKRSNLTSAELAKKLLKQQDSAKKNEEINSWFK